MALILLVEDENLLRWALRRKLEQRGHVVHEAVDLAEAHFHVTQHRPEVIILDINLPDGNGLDFLASHQDLTTESMALVITAVGQVEDAVRAMKMGVFDFLSKPVDHEELVAAIEHAVARQRERSEAEGFRRAREGLARVKIIAASPAMRNVLTLATGVAASTATTILIESETGTGKEVLARYIHANSPRADAPFLALNCAALPEHLVESELFGHEKGAFTDAKATRKGIFELANGGTVVLDEIGDLPIGLQAKLLRFLEDWTFRRVGGSREIMVDVRVVALTNRSLDELVAAGEFRRDLFYRLNVFPITIPPLHDRPEDIEPLARHFIQFFNERLKKNVQGLTSAALGKLLAYPWPGNIRELRNTIERAVILERGTSLDAAAFPLDSVGQAQPASSPPANFPDGMGLDEVERLVLQRALDASNWNQSHAARTLKISRDRLRYKMKKHRLAGHDGGGAPSE